MFADTFDQISQSALNTHPFNLAPAFCRFRQSNMLTSRTSFTFIWRVVPLSGLGHSSNRAPLPNCTRRKKILFLSLLKLLMRAHQYAHHRTQARCLSNIFCDQLSCAERVGLSVYPQPKPYNESKSLLQKNLEA